MHTSNFIVVGALSLAVLGALVSPDPLLLVAVGVVLALGIRLLWPATDAPILAFPFTLQWLSVAVKPLETALTKRPLNTLGDFGQVLDPGAWLALAGVAALGLGMRLGAGRGRFDWARTLARDASQWPAGLILPVSLTLIVVGYLLEHFWGYAGSAAQLVLAFSGARDVGLFVLAYWCLHTGRALGVLGVVVAIEILFGMTGFFADFKEVLFVLLVSAAAARPKLGAHSVLGTSLGLTLLLVLAVFWSSIKTDYRSFLNEGTGHQIVTRPLGERLGYVGQAADEFNNDRFQIGLRELVSRVSYIDFLSSTVSRVPNDLPFERGKRLGGALLNMAMPRILFPDKPPTPNDSEVTMHYTGLGMDLSGDTSVSIGYLGELYIDFGFIGAIVGAFTIGLLGGKIYATLRSYTGIPLFVSYGIAIMALIPFTMFETDLVRFLGSAVTIFAASLLLQRVAAPQLLLAIARRAPRVATS